MARVMRRTPATEEAASYGYRDFLQDIVKKVVADTTRGLKEPLDLSNEALLEMGLAGVGAGTKIARGLGKGKFPFSLKTTDIPLWDAVLKKPAYHKKAKGIERRIEFMSPREYFGLVEKKTGFARDVGRPFASIANPEVVRKYAEAMRKGTKFPMPALEYRAKGEYFGQEGRHRMLAAKALGIDRIPVLVMRSTPEKKLMERFSKEGLKYDAFTEPLPGYGYHQWTLYGEGPAKGATFGTKTTELGEMEAKIASLIRKFSK